MRPLLFAIQFLTILPVPALKPPKEKELASSMAVYPAVGALLGLIAVGIYQGVERWFGDTPAVISAVVALVVLSGGLHLDGFADLCDGFYAGRTKEQRLLIMKDSHIGSMAVIGVACLLLVKVGFLTSVRFEWRLAAIILAPALARWAMVLLAGISHYARSNGGTGSPYIGRIPRRIVVLAAVITGGLAWWIGSFRGLVLFGVVSVFALLFRRWTYARIDGLTGDALGACGELVEALVWVAISLRSASPL